MIMKKIKARIKIPGMFIGKKITVTRKTKSVKKLKREEAISKILTFVENHKADYIGFIPYKRLYTDLTKHYGEGLISFNLMEDILKELDNKGILKLVIIDKKFKAIQFTPIERSEGIKQIIKLAIDKEGKITISDMIENLGFDLKMTNQFISILKDQRLVIETKDDLGGISYYFPDLFS